jgi:flagellar motor protein MotB
MGSDNTCPLWMMSFGDCMSLLVTFFVMLLAFTPTEEAKLAEALNAMKGALGLAQTMNVSEEVMNYDAIGRVKGKAPLAKWLTVSELSKVLPDAQLAADRFGRAQVGGAKKMVEIMMLEEGLAFIVHTDDVFREGNAEFIGKEYDELWRQIGGFATLMQNEVRVVCAAGKDGAADEVRRGMVGLSIERASKIEARLAAPGLCDPGRISISGKITDNPESRIEVVILGMRLGKEMSTEEIIVREKWN